MAKIITYYFDSKGNEVPKKKAVRALIQEWEDKKFIREFWIELSKDSKVEKSLHPKHVHTELEPDRFIRLFTGEMQKVVDSFRSKKLSRDKALTKASELIHSFTLRSVESARLRLAKQLKIKVNSLPPEMISRIKRLGQEYLDDFKEILGDAK